MQRRSTRTDITVHTVRVTVASLLLIAAAVACGGDPQRAQPSGARDGSASTPRTVDRNAYKVFPDRDAAADLAVPADQGGRGFTGDGWETNTRFDAIGDPSAVNGGTIRFHIPDFPATLRMLGPESNTELNDTIEPLVWETLLRLHPTTGEWIPVLATHWQIDADRRTFRFRLDPNARFSDGRAVTADDVVATWTLLVDGGLQDPAAQVKFGRFEKPVAESKYIVRVTSKERSWRDFGYLAGEMYILPAHVIATIDGAAYLREHNFNPPPGTGPYIIRASDIHKGQQLTLRRRTDYWAEKYRRNAGLHNFDEIHASVLRDPNLVLETFKKGDIDYYVATSSRQWVQGLEVSQVERGLIQKRKIFTDAPIGIQGLAFNTRRPPWNDIRVRRALAHLLNREALITKFFFSEYVPQNSYFAGGPYENPDNPKTPYDPQLAASWLAEAGWTERDARGQLVRNGRPLRVELLYAQKTSEPYLTVFQEDLRRVGIGMTLRLVTPETLFRLVMDRQFDLVTMGWSENRFPVPATLLSSALADRPNTNNITGFKHARVDALIAAYEAEFDPEKRVGLLREIDGLAAHEYHYILQWNMPFRRIAYWNRFGHPSSYLTRTGLTLTQSGPAVDLLSLWWHGGEAGQRLEAARRDGSSFGTGTVEVHPWR